MLCAEYIYILADVPHFFKNIKNMLITNKILYVTEEIQRKHNLPTNEIKASHIIDLIDHKKDFQFFLAPKLTENDLMPDHFSKMKVSNATHVISHDVSSALRFLSPLCKKPEYLTTAWFVNLIDRWFTFMSSRHPSVALSKLVKKNYDETIKFLKDFIDIFKGLYVGESRMWKPSQTGAIISTTSILEIQNEFLNNKAYTFLLTSRFTQDCLENLFGCVRAKQVIPTALQFKNNLKLISVSQYLKDVTNSSYDKDDREFLSGFLDIIPKTSPKINYSPVQLPRDIPDNIQLLNLSEKNSLYHIAGYIIHSIKKTTKTCNNCILAVGSTNFKKSTENISKLMRLKAFKKDTLFYCNMVTFIFFCEMESIFRKFYDIVSVQNIDLMSFYVEKIVNNCMFNDLCHNLKYKIIKRFVVFRLKIASKKKKKIQI